MKFFEFLKMSSPKSKNKKKMVEPTEEVPEVAPEVAPEVKEPSEAVEAVEASEASLSKADGVVQEESTDAPNTKPEM